MLSCLVCQTILLPSYPLSLAGYRPPARPPHLSYLTYPTTNHLTCVLLTSVQPDQRSAIRYLPGRIDARAQLAPHLTSSLLLTLTPLLPPHYLQPSSLLDTIRATHFLGRRPDDSSTYYRHTGKEENKGDFIFVFGPGTRIRSRIDSRARSR